MEVGRPMEDEQAAQEHPATGAREATPETPVASAPQAPGGFAGASGTSVPTEVPAPDDAQVTAESPPATEPLTAAEGAGEPSVNAVAPDASEVAAPDSALAARGAALAVEVPLTGEPRVDAALAGLGQLPLLPVGEHPAVFEQVHRGLREVLGELDGSASGPPGQPGRPGGGPQGHRPGGHGPGR
jgi:hypothetical protein